MVYILKKEIYLRIRNSDNCLFTGTSGCLRIPFYQLITQSWAGQFAHGIYEQWWLNQLKGINVYDYRIYGTQYNESAAQYYQKITYPGL